MRGKRDLKEREATEGDVEKNVISIGGNIKEFE